VNIKHASAIWLFPALVAFIAPIAAGYWYARDEAIAQQRAQLEDTASTVLARVEEVAYQLREASDQLALYSADPCSNEALRAMRISTLAHRYVQAALYIEDNQILCSSVELHRPPLVLGSSSGRNFRGSEIWVDVELPWEEASDPMMIVRADSGFGVALNADEVFFNLEPSATGVIVLEYTEEGPTLLAQSGELAIDASLVELVTERGVGTHVLGDNVVRFQTSEGDFTLGVLTLGLQSAAESGAGEQMLRVLPFALAGGTVLAALATLMFFRRRSFRKDIEAGIRQQEFFLQYQPIMDINIHQVIGAEALIRWHRNGELIQPDVFIPLAEREGVIQSVTDEVMRLVATDMAELLKRRDNFYISINVSGQDLIDPDLPARLQRFLNSAGVNANRFLIEITESSFADRQTTQESIRAIRQMGFRVAIDDFGTGFSNFAHLQLYDIDYLKIDRLFVETIAFDEVKTQLVFHLIELANKLKVDVIAEGVEQEVQADILRSKGVNCAQGWLYSKPISSKQLVTQLQPD